MKLFNGMRSSIKAAEAALAKRDKISAALSAEIGKLGQLARKLVDAEITASDRNAVAIIDGEAPPANDPEVSKIRGDIKRATSYVAGLRAALVACTPDFVNASDALAAESVAHNLAITEAFREEWARGVAAFSALLGKRQSLEGAMLRKFDLSAPMATAPDLKEIAEITRPRDLIAAVGQFLQTISEITTMPFRGLNAPFFDSSRVYELTKDVRTSEGVSLSQGEYVTDATFAPGYLALLSDVGHVRAVDDPRIASHSEAARIALLATSARLADEKIRAESGGEPIKSEWPRGLSTQDVRLAPELPAGTMGRRQETGSPLPWGDITQDLNAGKTV